jgi:hypothetical protein
MFIRLCVSQEEEKESILLEVIVHIYYTAYILLFLLHHHYHHSEVSRGDTSLVKMCDVPLLVKHQQYRLFIK